MNKCLRSTAGGREVNANVSMSVPSFWTSSSHIVINIFLKVALMEPLFIGIISLLVNSVPMETYSKVDGGLNIVVTLKK